MVDTSLNKKYKAFKGASQDFSPIPDGEYTVRVKEISPWKAETKNINVIQRDEKGRALKDEKNVNITELQKDCTFYNCNAKLEIVGGDYDGRLIFYNLTTHPNMPFQISSFLYGLGVSELSASEIDKTKGLMCLANIYTDSYDKHIQNKDTGLDEIKLTYINRVKSFKNIHSVKPNNDLDNNLGI